MRLPGTDGSSVTATPQMSVKLPSTLVAIFRTLTVPLSVKQKTFQVSAFVLASLFVETYVTGEIDLLDAVTNIQNMNYCVFVHERIIKSNNQTSTQ